MTIFPCIPFLLSMCIFLYYLLIEELDGKVEGMFPCFQNSSNRNNSPTTSIWVLLYFLSIFPLKESDYRHFRFFRKQQTNGEHPIAKQIHHKLTVIDVSGKLLSTEKIQDPINWYVSAFEIRINNTLINVRINHPVNFWFNAIGSNPVKPENEMSYGAKIYPDFDNASPYRFFQKFSSYKGAID